MTGRLTRPEMGFLMLLATFLSRVEFVWFFHQEISKGQRSARTQSEVLLGHTKLESTVRYLGIAVNDALDIDENTEV